ncbi:MAG TPA: hypothetical protein VF759_12455 [Allosphingosinicella sp.]|jgi:2'-5' RNA ligase
MKIVPKAAAALLALAAAGCQVDVDENTAERIENAADRLEAAADGAADAVENAAESAGDVAEGAAAGVGNAAARIEGADVDVDLKGRGGGDEAQSNRH